MKASDPSSVHTLAEVRAKPGTSAGHGMSPATVRLSAVWWGIGVRMLLAAALTGMLWSVISWALY
ncbi:MAG: hypothetical protein Q4B13_02105 [Lautropia sp.]|nr:hypothetical protein [Lautropia sp.]